MRSSRLLYTEIEKKSLGRFDQQRSSSPASQSPRRHKYVDRMSVLRTTLSPANSTSPCKLLENGAGDTAKPAFRSLRSVRDPASRGGIRIRRDGGMSLINGLSFLRRRTEAGGPCAVSQWPSRCLQQEAGSGSNRLSGFTTNGSDDEEFGLDNLAHDCLGAPAFRLGQGSCFEQIG